ncbi:MAG: DUF6178 family protein [bacterium]
MVTREGLTIIVIASDSSLHQNIGENMSTAIQVMDAHEQAKQKSAFLRLAIERIEESGAELDIADELQKCVVRVVQREGFDQRNPGLMKRAEAIVYVTVNLGLEYATKGNIDKAVTGLSRNPLSAFFQIGEKHVAELHRRVEQVRHDALISFVIDKKRRFYGVTDAGTEAQLTQWAEGRLSDHPVLPPATMAELQYVVDVLDRVEREIALAKKVDWLEALNPELNSFAARYFRRKTRNQSNPAGGVWNPFLASLMVNAMTSGWGTRVSGGFGGLDRAGRAAEEQILLIDRSVREFLEIIMFDYEQLLSRVPEASAKIAKAAFLKETSVLSGGYGLSKVVGMTIFAKKCSEAEVHEIIAMAGKALQGVADRVRDFYMGVESVDEPQHEEIDSFWRSQLFIHSTVEVSRRLDEEEMKAKRPWETVDKVDALKDLVKHLKAFHKWPEDARRKFLDTFDFDVCLSKKMDLAKKAELVMEFWSILQGSKHQGERNDATLVTAERIDWTSQASLVLELCKSTDAKGCVNYIYSAAQKVDWTPQRILTFMDPLIAWEGYQALSAALHKDGGKLSLDEWTRLIDGTATKNGPEAFLRVWNAMPEEYQLELILKTRPNWVSSYFNDLDPKKASAFFRKLLQERSKDPEYRREFYLWYSGSGRRNKGSFYGTASKEVFGLVDPMCERLVFSKD